MGEFLNRFLYSYEESSRIFWWNQWVNTKLGFSSPNNQENEVSHKSAEMWNQRKNSNYSGSNKNASPQTKYAEIKRKWNLLYWNKMRKLTGKKILLFSKITYVFNAIPAKISLTWFQKTISKSNKENWEQMFANILYLSLIFNFCDTHLWEHFRDTKRVRNCNNFIKWHWFIYQIKGLSQNKKDFCFFHKKYQRTYQDF